MPVAFDTNVLIYAHDLDAGAKRQAAVRLIRLGYLRKALLPTQAVAEFIHAASRKLRMSRERVHINAARFTRYLTVVSYGPDGLDDAIAAHRDHGLQIYDAIIWATVRRAGCTHLLTEDFQDGRSLGGVTFVNPFDPANAALVDSLLPVA